MVTAVTGAALNFLTGHPKKQDTTPSTTGASAGTGSAGTSETNATCSEESGTSGNAITPETTGTYTATGATTGTSEGSAADAASGTAASADPGVAASESDPGEDVVDNVATTGDTSAPVDEASTASTASSPAEDAADGTHAPRLGAQPETAENRIPNLPMTPRLRELIMQLKSPLPIPTGLHHFASGLHPDLDLLAASSPMPQAQQVKRAMIAAPATSLMAQANFGRHDVLALLGLDGSGEVTLN